MRNEKTIVEKINFNGKKYIKTEYPERHKLDGSKRILPAIFWNTIKGSEIVYPLKAKLENELYKSKYGVNFYANIEAIDRELKNVN